MEENISPINLTRTDIIGLSSEAKPQNQKDGTTFYEVDTGDFYIYYKGTWYNQNFDVEENSEENEENVSENNNDTREENEENNTRGENEEKEILEK